MSFTLFHFLLLKRWFYNCDAVNAYVSLESLLDAAQKEIAYFHVVWSFLHIDVFREDSHEDGSG